MSGFNRKITISYDYDEVKQGVKETNNQLKLLGGEYRAARSEANLTGKEVEKLGVRKDFLTEKIKILTDSLEKYKSRLDTAKEKESAASIEKYATEVQKTEAELRALEADLKAVNNALNEQQGFLGKSTEEWEKISSKLNSVGQDLTKTITVPVVAATGAAFKLGADYEQAVGKMEVVFKQNSATIEEWAKGALNNFGLSRLSATEMVADFGAMFDTFGFKMNETMDMSMNLTERVRDLGAFFNTTSKETAIALNAIFTGQTEPLRKFGVVLTQASLQEFAHAQGIRKKISEMTEAEKVQLRYNFVMEKTSISLGQYAREQDTAAAQMETFKETAKEIGVVFGEVVIPVILPFFEAINNGLKFIAGLDEGTRKFIVTLGLAVAAVGPILVGIAKIIDSILTVKKAFGLVEAGITLASKAGSAMSGLLSNTAFLGFVKWAAIIVAVAVAIWAVIEAINALLGKSSSVQGTMKELGNITGSVQGAKVRGYEVGSNYIEKDQLAYIHKGEAVIPADQNPWNPSAQNKFDSGSGDTIIIHANVKDYRTLEQIIKNAKERRQRDRSGGEVYA